MNALGPRDSETRSDDVAAPSPVQMSRRTALGKMSYVAPAIIALNVSKPGLGLGRSGAGGRGKHKGQLKQR